LLENPSNPGAAYKNHLDKLVGGSLRLALAHMEPGERYPTLKRCSARARPNAGGFLIDGVKTLVLDAPSANLFILTARIDDTDDVGIFLVPADSAGILLRSYVLIDGSQAADLQVNGVQVSLDSLLARGTAASTLFAEALDRACIALLAQAIGSMETCVQICGAYLKERKQFGQPIGQFQVLQHMATDMLVASHQSRSAMYHALANMAGTPNERGRAVSAAKIVIGEGSQIVSQLGVQLHGGYGVTDEYPISHHYRRLTVIEKSYGDIDFHVRRLSELT
jgi:alkylation response protein AidB-like acyl-CoA dehydrogenase